MITIIMKIITTIIFIIPHFTPRASRAPANLKRRTPPLEGGHLNGQEGPRLLYTSIL